MDKKLWHKSSLTALVLALVLTIIVGVFGQTKVAQAAQTTITYGIWDSRQEPGLRKLADEFEAANPDIKVDIQVAGWGEYWTMLEAVARSLTFSGCTLTKSINMEQMTNS